MGSEFQTAVQQRERVLLSSRAILQPIGNHRQMENRKTIGAQVSQARNFSLRRGLGQDLANEPQVTKVLFLRRQTERTEARRGLKRAQINRPNELLVWGQSFEKVMNNREKFFRQGHPLSAVIVLVPIDYLRQLLFEKVQGEILLGFEIIEQRAFG